MLDGNEFYNHDVNLNLKHADSDLSQKKNNENYCMVAARERIEWLDTEIKQMLLFL